MSAGRFGAVMRHIRAVLFLSTFAIACVGCTPEFPGRSVCSVHEVRGVSMSTGEFGATAIALSETRFLTCRHVTNHPEVALTVDGIPARIVLDGQVAQGMVDPAWESYQRDWAILQTGTPVSPVTVPEFWHREDIPNHVTAHCIGFGFHSRGEVVESHLREVTARTARLVDAPEGLLFLFPERMDLHGLSGGPVMCWDGRDHKWKVAGVLLGPVEAKSKLWHCPVDAAAARVPEDAIVRNGRSK